MGVLEEFVFDDECVDEEQDDYPNVLAHDLGLWTGCIVVPGV